MSNIQLIASNSQSIFLNNEIILKKLTNQLYQRLQVETHYSAPNSQLTRFDIKALFL